MPQAFYFSNTRLPLANVSLNGQPLGRQEFGFWTHSAPLPSSPVQFEFVAASGQKVTASCGNPLQPQVLDVNF